MMMLLLLLIKMIMMVMRKKKMVLRKKKKMMMQSTIRRTSKPGRNVINMAVVIRTDVIRIFVPLRIVTASMIMARTVARTRHKQ